MGMLMDMMARMGGHLVELEVIEYALDGLEGEARARAEGHLRDCGMCRSAVMQMMDLQDGLGLLVPEEFAPEDLAARVVESVRVRSAEDRQGPRISGQS